MKNVVTSIGIAFVVATGILFYNITETANPTKGDFLMGMLLDFGGLFFLFLGNQLEKPEKRFKAIIIRFLNYLAEE